MQRGQRAHFFGNGTVCPRKYFPKCSMTDPLGAGEGGSDQLYPPLGSSQVQTQSFGGKWGKNSAANQSEHLFLRGKDLVEPA